MTRVVKDMIKNLPKDVQPVLERNHLNMLLGLQVDSAMKPRLGKVWHKVTVFPNLLQANKPRTSQ